MDTKRLILNVTVVLALFLSWNLVMKTIAKRHPNWVKQPEAATQPAATATTLPAPGQTTPTPGHVEPTTPGVPSVAPAVAGLHAESVVAGVAEVKLGSYAHGDPTFPMALSLDPRGASIGRITLNDYFRTAAHQDPLDPSTLYAFQEPLAEEPEDTRPLATQSVTIDGREVDLSHARWRQTSASVDGAAFALRILDGDRPVLELAKSFALKRRDAQDGSKGFDVAVAQSFHNLTDHPLQVTANYNGPTAPTAENARSEDRRFITAYDEGDQYIKTFDTFVNELSKGKPAKDLATIKPMPLVWVGTCNSYFDAIVRPDVENGGVRIANAPAVGLSDETHNAAFNFVTNTFAVPVAATVPFDLHAFFGPKSRELLNNNYYAAFPRKYDETLVYISQWCGFLTFSWLINALYGILWFFHKITFDWGLAIIGLVLLVRTLLHPITKRAQINMMGMSKMGPELERLKKKYGDDKEAMAKAQWQLTKEQGLTPILGCLPMLLQTPIWLALWNALQSTFDMRQAGFLRWGHLHLTWINDLSQPDALVTFAHPIPLLFFTVHSINVLPMILAVVFAVQQMVMPKPATMTPEQEQQRKMMQWMLPLMYPFFFYVSPSGLNLYILTSTSLGIIEGKIIRKHIKERDEAAKSGQIVVDAPAGKRKGKPDAPQSPAKPKGRIASMLADLQAKAEQVIREAEQKKKNDGGKR